LIWIIPDNEDIGSRISVISDPDLLVNCCEYNCDNYINRFGGKKIEGVYVLKHNMLNLYQLIRHFVVFDGNNLIDITPFEDSRTHNWFIPSKINYYNKYVQSLDLINKSKEQEVEIMYYIYCYINPLTKLPMYVGKGQKDRAYVHIKHAKKERKHKNNTRFLNKLESLLQEDKQPDIIFIAQNIEDENIAYDIEESFIKQYGRVGYDPDGILLNICEGSRPPNKKGKTYKEIYGDNAEEQRLKRHKLQQEAGGWFKGHKHTKEMKQKHSMRFSGKGNPRYGVKVRGTNTAKKISAATKGKKRPQMSYVIKLTNQNKNRVYEILFSELKAFCNIHGISVGTLQNQLYKRLSPSKYGKTAGWKIERKETEISSYQLGFVKQGVDDDTFTGFTL